MNSHYYSNVQYYQIHRMLKPILFLELFYQKFLNLKFSVSFHHLNCCLLQMNPFQNDESLFRNLFFLLLLLIQEFKLFFDHACFSYLGFYYFYQNAGFDVRYQIELYFIYRCFFHLLSIQKFNDRNHDVKNHALNLLLLYYLWTQQTTLNYVFHRII